MEFRSPSDLQICSRIAKPPNTQCRLDAVHSPTNPQTEWVTLHGTENVHFGVIINRGICTNCDVGNFVIWGELNCFPLAKNRRFASL